MTLIIVRHHWHRLSVTATGYASHPSEPERCPASATLAAAMLGCVELFHPHGHSAR